MSKNVYLTGTAEKLAKVFPSMAHADDLRISIDGKRAIAEIKAGEIDEKDLLAIIEKHPGIQIMSHSEAVLLASSSEFAGEESLPPPPAKKRKPKEAKE